MKLSSYIVILIVISGCSLNKDSAYWTEDSVKKKADSKKLNKIIEKSNDIRSMTVEEYEIYIYCLNFELLALPHLLLNYLLLIV